MNDLTNDLFNRHLPAVQTLLRSHAEFSPEKRTEISDICQKSFLQLQNDLVKFNTSMNDSSYKLTDKLSNLTLYSTHLKAVQELLQIEITDPSLLVLFNEEGMIAVESLNKQLHHAYQTLIDDTKKWAENPQVVVEQKRKKILENTFTHLINLAPQYGQSDLIPVLEKRRDFICSYFKPYHLIRDRIFEMNYIEPNLYYFVLSCAEKSIPLAEQVIECVETFKNAGLSKDEIANFLQELKSASSGFSFSIDEDSLEDDGPSLSGGDPITQVFFEYLKYFKSEPIGDSKELKNFMSGFLSSLKMYTLKEKLLILKACNSENGEVYKKLFLSKIPASKIQEYLLQETGNDDAYYTLYNQPWNLSDWPEKFALYYQLNEKQLQPVLQKIFHGTYENKLDKIQELSLEVKEAFSLLFQQIEQSPEPHFPQKCWELIGKCNKTNEIRNLANILKKDPKYIEFLEKLPQSLLHTVLNRFSDVLKEIHFLSKLEFFFQTHFISLLNDDFDYEESLNIYRKNPEFLKTRINLQDSLGGKSLSAIKGPNTLIYFQRHPEFLKAYVDASVNLSHFSLADHPIESLIQQNKEDWIEKIFILFGNSTNLHNIFTYLKKDFPNEAIVHLLNQDLSLIKRHQSEFKVIARELIKSLDSNNEISRTETNEAVTKMLLIADSKGELLSNSELLKELTQHFSLNQIKNISGFLTQFSLIENEKTKSEVLKLIREGNFDVACLCLEHQFSQKIETLSVLELFEQILKLHPPETQNKISDILQFWSHSNEQLPYAELNKLQLSLLSKLLMLSKDNPKAFQILGSLLCTFPLPEGEKLMQLTDLNITHLECFHSFLKIKPEYGWHLLDYLIKNRINGSDLLTFYLPDHPQVVDCFRSRDPAKALNSMIDNLRQRQAVRFGSLQVFSPSSKNTLLPGLNRAPETKNVKRLEALLSNASEEYLIYLQQLTILEIQQTDSQLVTTLLGLYPQKYESLALLGMEGYSKEAAELLRRSQQEVPVSPFIELLLKTSATDGRWLTAALKLDHKSTRLIDYLGCCKFVGDLEKQMTYLAASGDLESVDRLLDVLEKTSQKSPQSQALLDWTMQGNLTLVQWIGREDTMNEDPVYVKIRACSPTDLQEGLIQLYRNLSEHPHMRKDSVAWILGQKNPQEQLAKLLYLQAQGIQIDNFEAVDTLFLNYDPVSQLNAVMASTVFDPSFSSLEKNLKIQFQFVVAASVLLLNSDGSINKGLIKELKKSDFFLENQANETTVYKYLEWVLNLFEMNGEFSERLVKGASVPPQGSPAYNLLLETLGKKKEEILNRRDVQVAILSSLLQRPWQSPKVGSCFGTSVVSQSQATPSFLLQTLDDYLELAAKNSLQRTLKNCTTAYPLSGNLKTSSSEHTFAKAREYCISSMGATQDSTSMRSMTAKAFNNIHFLLGLMGRENPESYEAVQALQQRFKEDFLQGTLEFYDPFLSWEKKDIERLGMDVQGMLGGWILGRSTMHTMIDTQEKFEAYLLELIEILATKNESPLFLKGVALLKEKIINHDLSQLKLQAVNATSWTYAVGGHPEIVSETYFEQDVKKYLGDSGNSQEGFLENHSQDLKLLKTYASCIDPASKGKISVAGNEHAYSLISERLLSLNNYQTFEDLHAILLETSNAFAQLPITAALSAKCVDEVCLLIPKNTGERLREYLKKQPIPECSLRDYGWALTDALLRVSNAAGKDMNAAKVEAALLNLPELKNERPEHIVVGDYNWFNNQNACYAAYAISPFTNQLEPYYVGERGSNLYPQYRLSNGLKIYSKMAEKPWQPLK